MKRAAMGLLVVVLLVAPRPALAKVPWHSVEILPAAPVAGEPLTVVVRFWDDAARTQPSTWWPGGDHGGILAFDGAAGRVLLTLTRTGDATFRSAVTLTEGTWRLVVVQQFADISGPAEVELATVSVGEAPDTAPPIGAAVIGAALVAAGVIWRGRRSSTPIERD